MEPISKKQSKQFKILRKREAATPEARQQYFEHKLFIENDNDSTGLARKDGSNELEMISAKEQLQMGLGWWNWINEEHFSDFSKKDILRIKDSLSNLKFPSFSPATEEHLESYREEYIYGPYPHLHDETLLHVLLKSAKPFAQSLLSFQIISHRQSNRSRSQQIEAWQSHQNNSESQSVITKVTPYFSPQTKQGRQCSDPQILDNLLKDGELILKHSICEPNSETITKAELVAHKDKENCQSNSVNAEIYLWEKQLQRLNSLNGIFWNKLLAQTMSKQEERHCTENSNTREEVFTIKQELMHNTILRYMEYGTKDKTNQMLKSLIDSLNQIKPAKSRDSQLSTSGQIGGTHNSNKKFFETDCKICFSSFNSDTNQVLYCDRCNTSFHLACYGLDKIPQEKEYFCDCCTELINEEEKSKVNIKKITCQLCCKPNFPLKKVNGHFYHMTCLILFNFVTLQKGRICLRNSLTHKDIARKVIQNEVSLDENCLFCGENGGDIGMRLKCADSKCRNTMHPICAYINGCLFKVSKKQKDLNVQVFCTSTSHPDNVDRHRQQQARPDTATRDHIEQTYLRRYMCNLKNTSQKSREQFLEEYSRELQNKKNRSLQEGKSKKNQLSLIQESKLIKRHIATREMANKQKAHVGSEQIMTESRRMLEKLASSHRSKVSGQHYIKK